MGILGTGITATATGVFLTILGGVMKGVGEQIDKNKNDDEKEDDD